MAKTNQQQFVLAEPHLTQDSRIDVGNYYPCQNGYIWYVTSYERQLTPVFGPRKTWGYRVAYSPLNWLSGLAYRLAT